MPFADRPRRHGGDTQRVLELFPALKTKLGQAASILAGGQQQMVTIGRTLIGSTWLLLLDEPTVRIAHRLEIEVVDALRSIRTSGVAVLMAEQDAQNTLCVTQRVYVLEEGRVTKEWRSKEMVHDEHIHRIHLGVRKHAFR